MGVVSAEAADSGPPPVRAGSGSSDRFLAATGDGPATDQPLAPRASAVQVAFEGLLQIRRLTNGMAADPAAVPAPWELHQMTRAVALALEASGITPSATDATRRRMATGYRVRPADGPGAVVVEWLGPPGSGAAAAEQAELTACIAVLEPLGWDALLYRGPHRRWFVEVRPPHGTP
jgi:hypothetical protein